MDGMQAKAWAMQFADDLEGPLGPVPLQRVIAAHLLGFSLIGKALNLFGLPLIVSTSEFEALDQENEVLAIPVAIQFPEPQKGAGRRINSEAEKTLVDALCLHGTMTHFALMGLGLSEYEAQKKVQAAIPELSIKTILDNGRKLIPKMTGASSAREMNRYQRQKIEIMKNRGNLAIPEDGLGHEIQVLESISKALNRARKQSQDAYEFRKKSENGQVPTTDDLIRTVLGDQPNPRPLHMLWIAAHGQVNPADLWPNFEFARNLYYPASLLGRLLMGRSVEASTFDIQCILSVWSENDSGGQTEEDLILRVMQHWIDFTIGENQLSILIDQVRRGSEKVSITPIQT